MLDYNMNDSRVTALLWGLTGADQDIPNLACVLCAPVWDCIRYVTGMMSATVIASECLSRGMCFCWAKCLPNGKYQGGYVAAPTRGIHDDVAVCDFSSMYPTIMIGANISPDAILTPAESLRSEGAVTWDGYSVSAVCSGRTARFSTVNKGVVPQTLQKLVDERRKHKASRPTRAMALKVGANSIYGSFVYEMSTLYSPSCSAATTAFGRWCLALSICVFEKCGLRVIYGDTDSCFLSGTNVTAAKYHGSLRDHCNAALAVLKCVLGFTPFRDMDMCLEGLHKRMLLLGKKNYAYMSSSGDVRYKGIPVARKDALGICRKVSKCTVDMILYGGSTQEAKSAIALMCARARDSCALSSLTLMDLSKVIRAEGGSCYTYVDFNGDPKNVKIEDASPEMIVQYSKAEIATRISKEVTRYTSAAGLGTVYDIMWVCPVFESLGYVTH
ncbi:DNA/RNA polymerase [Aspergillus sclerotioniger CBS 115572]|uniref:DNA-directed DNA polymerase n=1 Tax=Aspergillus sclerotioniger CBS 115572 TaxID=1450535 RepID=A0A317V784_9EURO|nr:DNA/RNA polymerase [Aspergillus sclerotioniger CBS 115572]PWY68000.1 DNA/RNA polymerase [Aspergillus sclerotioniger CBS 115572]